MIVTRPRRADRAALQRRRARRTPDRGRGRRPPRPPARRWSTCRASTRRATTGSPVPHRRSPGRERGLAVGPSGQVARADGADAPAPARIRRSPSADRLPQYRRGVDGDLSVDSPQPTRSAPTPAGRARRGSPGVPYRRQRGSVPLASIGARRPVARSGDRTAASQLLDLGVPARPGPPSAPARAAPRAVVDGDARQRLAAATGAVVRSDGASHRAGAPRALDAVADRVGLSGSRRRPRDGDPSGRGPRGCRRRRHRLDRPPGPPRAVGRLRPWCCPRSRPGRGAHTPSPARVVDPDPRLAPVVVGDRGRQIDRRGPGAARRALRDAQPASRRAGATRTVSPACAELAWTASHRRRVDPRRERVRVSLRDSSRRARRSDQDAADRRRESLRDRHTGL